MADYIKDIVRRITARCAVEGVAVTDTLAAFLARAVVLEQSDRFGLDDELTDRDISELVHLCIDRLHNESPSLLTVRLQVDFDTQYASELTKAQNDRSAQEKKTAALVNDIISVKAKGDNDADAFSSIYRKVFHYLVSSATPMPDVAVDRTVEMEIAAALESVFPKVGLRTFVLLTLEDKKSQLRELANIIMGIRLFNREIGKGGAGLDDATSIALKDCNQLLSNIEDEKTQVRESILQYVEVIAASSENDDLVKALKAELINRRQYVFCLDVIAQDASETLKHVEMCVESFKEEMGQLRDLIGNKTSVPKDVVYPKFDILARHWYAVCEERTAIVSLQRVVAAVGEYRTLPASLLDIRLVHDARAARSVDIQRASEYRKLEAAEIEAQSAMNAPLQNNYSLATHAAHTLASSLNNNNNQPPSFIGAAPAAEWETAPKQYATPSPPPPPTGDIDTTTPEVASEDVAASSRPHSGERSGDRSGSRPSSVNGSSSATPKNALSSSPSSSRPPSIKSESLQRPPSSKSVVADAGAPPLASEHQLSRPSSVKSVNGTTPPLHNSRPPSVKSNIGDAAPQGSRPSSVKSNNNAGTLPARSASGEIVRPKSSQSASDIVEEGRRVSMRKEEESLRGSGTEQVLSREPSLSSSLGSASPWAASSSAALPKPQVDLIPKNSVEFNNAKLEYRGFCPVSLVDRDTLLLPANSSVGYIKYRGLYYGFVNDEAAQAFSSRPDSYLAKVIETVRQNPELIQLLRMQSRITLRNGFGSFSDVPSFAASSLQGTNNKNSAPKVDADCQTVVHPIEKFIDPKYEWNEWRLRRRALQLANLRYKQTHSAQTVLSHFRREAETQHYASKPAETQTGSQAGTNPPHQHQYVAGLRGNPDSKMKVVNLTLEGL